MSGSDGQAHVQRGEGRTNTRRPEAAICGPLQITLFVRALNVGGAERVMLDLARGLVEAGEDVELVVLDSSGPYRSIVPESVPLVSLDRPRLLRALPILASHLRRRAPTVALTTGTHANVAVVVAARLARRRVRVVVRQAATTSVALQAKPGFKRRVLPALERIAYRRADVLIAPSEGLADELRERLGPRRAHRVSVLRSPIDVDAIQQQAAAPSPHSWLDAQAPVVLSVGRLAPQKDHETLLRAFALLRQRYPDVRLILLGEGAERQRIEGIIGDLSLGGAVAMPGVDTNPFRWIARADVLALTSRWEGMPNVLLQAVACGTPAVATDCPHGAAEAAAMSDLITLAPVGDAAAIAVALDNVLAEPRHPDMSTEQPLDDFRLEQIVRRLRSMIMSVATAR